MTHTASQPWILATVGGAGIGFLLGVVYFASMRRTIGLFIAGTSIWTILPQTLFRFVVAGSVFLMLAQWNAEAAIGGLIGFAIARQWAVNRAGSD